MGRVELRQVEGGRVVALVGEFDLSNADALRRCFADLRESGAKRVVLDLSETTYIDSSMIGVIAWEHERGLTLAIRGANGGPLRALQISGISRIVEPDPGD